MEQDKTKLVEVFEGELWKATMIQHVLEDNQIQSYIKNGLMGTIEPWVVSAGGVNPFKLIVSDVDYKRAIHLIDEFNNTAPSEEV
ncbi:putative signal transducing protein [Arcticibacter eurypsychrophilus]|uniref:putative signal transducing protein n=1 Tax=Arcticibacter eurypsychrophilus TaxID=1434752 RepID=UPI00084D55F2|nr:DUF2007 domain-containing protein [Arcticibacter eurypsychrophilus]